MHIRKFRRSFGVGFHARPVSQPGRNLKTQQGCIPVQAPEMLADRPGMMIKIRREVIKWPDLMIDVVRRAGRAA
jgi:hypothetical protein